MKQISGLIGALLCAVTISFAQPGPPPYSHYTIASGNWSDASTWANGNIPVVGGTATVGIYNSVVLDTDVYVLSVSVQSSGTLSCSSGNRLSLAEGGSFGCVAGTSTNFTLGSLLLMGNASVGNAGGSATVEFYDVDVCLGTVSLGGVTINGTLTVKGGTITDPPVYGPSSTLTYFSGEAFPVGGEWATNITTGAGVPMNVVVLTTATLPEGSGSRHVRGNLTAQSNGTLNLNNILTVDGSVSQGNSTIGYGTITCNTSHVKFVGTGDQSIQAEYTLYLYDVTVDKPSGRVILTEDDGTVVRITGIATLTSGVVEVSTLATLMIDEMGIIAGNPNSFVDGPLTIRKSGGGMATFPVGDGAAYRPFTVTVDGSNCVMVGRMVNAGYPASGDGLSHVSLNRHWEFGYLSGTFNSATIELTYGADDGVSDPENLRVARVDPMFSLATNLGGMGNGSPSGSIASSSFSPGTWDFFALGNVNGGTNALPITLASFTGLALDARVTLSWSTVSEVNNYGFDIERRSGSADEWRKVGFVEGSGTTIEPREYGFADLPGAPGRYEYRLKQLDLDGTAHYSDPVSIDVPAGVTAVAEQAPVPLTTTLAQNYPNPFNPSTTIEFTVAQSGPAKLAVYDLLGRAVALLADGEYASGVRHRVQLDGSRLTSGVYFYRLTAGGSTAVRTLTLTK